MFHFRIKCRHTLVCVWSCFVLVCVCVYVPFTIIAFEMACGFHLLSFRSDRQRRFPFISIHLHNSMHLETLTDVICMKGSNKKVKMKALCVSHWYSTRNQKLMWVKWLETEKPNDRMKNDCETTASLYTHSTMVL